MKKRFAWIAALAALYVPPFVLAWVPPMAGHWHCQEIYLRWMPVLPGRMALGFRHPEGVLGWVLAAGVPAVVLAVLVATLVRKPRFGWALLALVAVGNLVQAGIFVTLLRM